MSELININEADVAALTEISGIGEALAARIVAYRETVHSFEEVIELTAVPGISERMVRQFEDRVTVGAVEPLVEEEVMDAVETAVLPPAELRNPEVSEPPAPLPAYLPAAESSDDAIAEEDAVETDAPAAEIEFETVRVEADEPIEDEDIFDPAPVLQEEPEPIMTTESRESERPERETPPPPANDVVSQRRGCIFIIIGAVAGAILGTALTLALLAALNGGSLLYADANTRLRGQLEDVTNSLDTLNQELESANQNLDAVATRAGTLADDQSEMSDAITGVETTLGDAQAGLETAQEAIGDLQETAVTLDERIDTISQSAETFDAFLTGMRDLLVDLQGMPVPTMTPFTTITPMADDAATGSSDGAETAVTVTPIPSRAPTRTPRPTSTPISLPTATPEQQP